MKLIYLIAGVMAVAAAGAILMFRSTSTAPVTPVSSALPEFSSEPVTADMTPMTEDVTVVIKTNHGDITVVLKGEAAPMTVGNFVKLAQSNFYDGTTFHRVIPDFMIQGGDPLSKDTAQRARHGMGDPGYAFADEINAESYGLHHIKLTDVVDPAQLQQLPPEAQAMTLQQFYETQGYQYRTDLTSLPLERGYIAMANSGPNTNGSQFFIITAEATPYLAGKHTVFGMVTQGMDVVDQISQVSRDQSDNPVEPVVIEDIVITRSGV